MIIKLNKELLAELTNTEKQIINYINENYQKIPGMSIIDLAEETYTSPASVSRAVKKCQLAGFSELRYLISERLNNKEKSKPLNDAREKSLLEISNTIEYLSLANILEAVDIIRNSRKIYVIARGLSELVAREFSLKLQLLGFNTFQIADPNIIKSLTGENLHPQDLIYIFSLYGQTESLLIAAENAVSIDARVISCCCAENTPLKELSNVFLQGYKHEHHSIKNFEVSSRLPLYTISRIVVDYLVQAEENK
ncbi:MurR/RpiR family transcriptional regulator [Halanaerobium salsuginis]|jgi:DNA-binding MurR/RpiR family transcriptional regulator|uniref:Transcriptional regulator, RpiR family n=1 Tax=Halanaerobium salsuginis TaxID=29563 RepID=A0A1I4GUI9_9FIRM|nr:MurR/RpiR family transcriptional regulator [Halanaerobium salsuginis]SFL33113.1 transcriptional regulator, RpiR family [Halanaerobium salsuginis]